MIAATQASPAHDSMARQFEECGAADSGSYSLDAMWRAAGRPIGRTPAHWLALADGLVQGVAAYFANLEGGPIPADQVTYVMTPEWADENEVRGGDYMATFLLAEVYARFLDYGNQEVRLCRM